MIQRLHHYNFQTIEEWEETAFARPLPYDKETTKKRLLAMEQLLGMLTLQGTLPDKAFIRSQEFFALGLMDRNEAHAYLQAVYARNLEKGERA